MLERVAIPFSRMSSRPRAWILVSCGSCIAGEFFTTKPPGKPLRSFVTKTCSKTSIRARFRSQTGLGQKWLLLCRESHAWFSFNVDPLTLSSYIATASPPEKFGITLPPVISVWQLLCVVCSHVPRAACLCLVVKKEVGVAASALGSLEAELGIVHWLLRRAGVGGGCVWIPLVFSAWNL